MASQGYVENNDKVAMEELEKSDVNNGSINVDEKRMTRKILWKLDTR